VPAPNAKLREEVKPQGPEAPTQEAKPAECGADCTHHRPLRLSGARLIKRVQENDLQHCPNCGGKAFVCSKNNRRLRGAPSGFCAMLAAAL